MGFLKNDGEKKEKPKDDAYLDVTGEPKAFRPTMREPQAVWVHKIPSVKTKMANGFDNVVRQYRTELCTSNSRNGAGCRCCTTPDPLWDRLEEKNRFNRKGARVDFPKTPIHVMTVVERGPETVKILKGGNQTYENMDQWHSLQKTEAEKDLRRCDWTIWKTGKDLLTKYNTSRMDPSEYVFTQTQLDEAKRLLQKAIDDLKPGPLDEFLAFIKGDDTVTSDTVTTTTATVAPVVATAPAVVTREFNPLPATPVVTQPVQSAPAPVQQATAGENTALKDFGTWMNQQPEFRSKGLLDNLVPAVKEFNNGDIAYHKLPPEKLSALKEFLEMKLAMMRVK